MSVSRCVGFKLDFPLVRFNDGVEYENDLSPLCGVSIGRCYPKLVCHWSSLRRLLSHLCFAEHLDYWGRDCDFDLRCVIIPEAYLRACTTSSCSPSGGSIGQLITLGLQVGGESGEDLAFFAYRILWSLPITLATL